MDVIKFSDNQSNQVCITRFTSFIIIAIYFINLVSWRIL